MSTDAKPKLSNAEFVKGWRTDIDNKRFWAYSSGDHLNALEEALDRLEAAEAENAELRKQADAWKKVAFSGDSVKMKMRRELDEEIDCLNLRLSEQSKELHDIRAKNTMLEKENAELRASHTEQEEMVAELRKLAQENRAKVAELEKKNERPR